MSKKKQQQIDAQIKWLKEEKKRVNDSFYRQIKEVQKENVEYIDKLMSKKSIWDKIKGLFILIN